MTYPDKTRSRIHQAKEAAEHVVIGQGLPFRAITTLQPGANNRQREHRLAAVLTHCPEQLISRLNRIIDDVWLEYEPKTKAKRPSSKLAGKPRFSLSADGAQLLLRSPERQKPTAVIAPHGHYDHHGSLVLPWYTDTWFEVASRAELLMSELYQSTLAVHTSEPQLQRA